MRRPAFLLQLGLMASMAFGPAVLAESVEIIDEPHAGRFVYLRSASPIVHQASPLYAAAMASRGSGRKGRLTPPDGLELDPRGDRSDLIERGVTLFRVPGSAAPRGLDTPPPPDADDPASQPQ